MCGECNWSPDSIIRDRKWISKEEAMKLLPMDFPEEKELKVHVLPISPWIVKDDQN